MTATRVIAYLPNGASQGPVPTPQDVQVGYPLNDVGALTLNYPPDAPRASLLGQPVELAVEVSWDGGLTWTEPASSRFMYLRDGRDPIKTGDAFQVEAAGYVMRCQKALVGFTGLNAEGNREFTTATPGTILGTLWDEAVARGALEGMSRDFTATQDSAGTPWPETIPSIAYEPGKDLLAILMELAEMGLVDFRTQGRTLQMFVQENTSGMGADRTTGAAPVVLRYGRDLTEAPFRRTWEGLADTVMVMGDNGANLTRTSVAAIKPWGRQETYATASGVDDQGTLTVVADAILTLSERERTEHTFGLDFRATPHMPFRDYAPGEWVLAATSGDAAPQRMRVRQITLTRDDDGNAGGNVVLNDRFLEADVLQARRIQRLTQGATQGGTGTTPGTSQPPSTGNDILAPAQVQGLVATSAAYLEPGGRVRAQITLDWVDVTTNADGTVASDVDHYEVWARRPTVSPWAQVATTVESSWTNSPYEPGQDWEFQVRAVDAVFNRGQFSAAGSVTTSTDTTPPVKPSTPTATTRLGTGRIAWDGLSATGGAMDDDFTHVTVHVSQVNNFAPDATNRVDELGGAGYVVVGPLSYSATYYARLVPWDSSGNAGTPSDVVTLTVAALVDVTNFPDDAMTDLYARTGKFLDLSADNFSANLIKGMWLEAGTVEADRLAIGSRGQTVLTNSYMEQADANGKPTHWIAQWGWDQVTLAGETAAPLSGTRSLLATLTGVGANITIGTHASEFPVVEGQKWYVRATVKAVAATNREVNLTGHSSTAATQPFAIFDGNAHWHNVGAAGSANVWAAGQVRILEGAFTISAGHTKGNVSVRILGDGLAGDVFVVDSIEAWPAVTDSQVTEIGAGKIKTGLLQATERIVAGSLTGARAELNGVGFQAFNSAGTKTMEVKASDGSFWASGTFTTAATSGVTRVVIGAYTNPYESNQSWNTIQFFPQQTTWDPALIWGAYGSGNPNWGVLQLASPKLGTRSPARLTLRSEEQTNNTIIEMNANIVRGYANTYEWGDPNGTALVFRMAYVDSDQSMTWSFRSPGNKRIDFLYGTLGVNRILSKDESNAWEHLNIECAELEFVTTSTGGNLVIHPATQVSNRVSIGNEGSNNSLMWGGGSQGNLRCVSYYGGAFVAIAASAFNVNSDMRAKRNAIRAREADRTPTKARIMSSNTGRRDVEPQTLLEKVRAVEAFDYETPHGQHRRSSDSPLSDGKNLFRQRGLMAQDIQQFWPDAVYDDDADGTGLSVDLYHLLTTAWAAIQELADEVDTLKAAQAPRKP